jgi:hypothetical protein
MAISWVGLSGLYAKITGTRDKIKKAQMMDANYGNAVRCYMKPRPIGNIKWLVSWSKIKDDNQLSAGLYKAQVVSDHLQKKEQQLEA